MVKKPIAKASSKRVSAKKKAASPVRKSAPSMKQKKAAAPSKRKAVTPAAKASNAKAKKITTPMSSSITVKGPFNAKELETFRIPLMKLREQITGRISSLTDDTLHYVDDTPAEDRTDDFDREFALNLVSSEQDLLFEIDDALRRIQLGSYGKCDSCSCKIEKGRLHALPFARMCLKCQSESERGRARFRPFGETLSQGTEPASETSEVEEAE